MGVLDQTNDLGQGAVGTDGGGADDEGAGAVEGGADHGAAVGLVDGEGLAGADPDQVTDGDLIDRDVVLGAVAQHAGGLRGERDEGVDGGGGALLGAQLEPAAHQDQCDHDQGRLGVQVQRKSPGLGLPGPQGDERAVTEGDASAEGDQGVHAGGAVLGRGPGGTVDVVSGPGLDDSGDDQDERHQPVHGVQVQRQVHDAHQAQAGGQGDLPLALESPDLGVPCVIGVVGRPGGELGRGARLVGGLRGAGGGGVPGLGDRGGQLIDADGGRVVGDQGGLGGQVDRDLDHPLDPGQCLLDAADAGGAGHAPDVEAGLGGASRSRTASFLAVPVVAAAVVARPVEGVVVVISVLLGAGWVLSVGLRRRGRSRPRGWRSRPRRRSTRGYWSR